MYRHLLVPIDETDLSVEVVGEAVNLARSLGARITFFHAVADHAASLFRDAEVVRATAPDVFAYAYTGKARELLAKAEAAARAVGVPCDSMHAVSNKPAGAIVDAARGKGCDLIFMASHGSRSPLGMALASATVHVLMNGGLPVLVAASGNPRPAVRTIGIIRDEHRSLAAVLHAWMHTLAEARAGGSVPDPVLMRAMISYIERFPVALHHPKEDDYLFKRLRQRNAAMNIELDELERQHVRDSELVAGLRQRVETLAAAAAGDAQTRAAHELEEALAHYAAFTWEHLGREEGVILPAAQRHLTEGDWVEIDAAFSENGDPRFGAEDRDMRHLFSRIVNLAAA